MGNSKSKCPNPIECPAPTECPNPSVCPTPTECPNPIVCPGTPPWYYGSQSSSTNYTSILMNLLATSFLSADGYFNFGKFGTITAGEYLGYIESYNAYSNTYIILAFTAKDSIISDEYYISEINSIPIQQITSLLSLPSTGIFEITGINTGSIAYITYILSNQIPNSTVYNSFIIPGTYIVDIPNTLNINLFTIIYENGVYQWNAYYSNGKLWYGGIISSTISSTVTSVVLLTAGIPADPSTGFTVVQLWSDGTVTGGY